MADALGWGALAASSLVVGALLGIARLWPDRAIGVVLAFGAGALVSAVSFDLAQEGVELGGGDSVALGLAAGALTYFLADRAVDRLGEPERAGSSAVPAQTAEAGTSAVPAQSSEAGTALALGAFLDGIPEQMVLGIGLAAGGGISVGLLAAIFISNLPEAIGSATEMRAAGQTATRIRRLWIAVALICTLATVAGYAIADNASGDLQASINGFAAGALLVMLIDSMIPEAALKAGKVAGLVTVFGFAVAAWLSGVS
ncbi:MAG: ZIP family metal transporter [Candidatus Limnocylindrales bacterium]